MSLERAGVALFDCEHKTPSPATEGIPYITIPEMRSGHLDVTSARLVASEHVPIWNRRVEPQAGDVIVSRRTNPGVSAVVPLGLRCVLGQNLVILRSEGTIVDQQFLRWLVRGPGWWRQIQKFLNVGAVFDSLRCADIPRFELAIPPLDEQLRIAHILGTLDDKIELNRRMRETLEAMARALFKSWFVDFEPVRANAEGRDSRLRPSLARLFPDSLEASGPREIPKGWRVGKVGDLCEGIFSGGTPSTKNPEYWDGQIPWLSSGETRQSLVVETERRISRKGVENSSTRLAPAMSTVIASAGQGNTRGQTSLLAIESYVNQSVVVLKADSQVSSPLHLFFELERRYEEFRRVSDAHSSRGSLTTKLLANLGTVVPGGDVVTAFETLSGPLIERAVGCLREARVVESIRDTLLPKLLTGEIGVETAA